MAAYGILRASKSRYSNVRYLRKSGHDADFPVRPAALIRSSLRAASESVVASSMLIRNIRKRRLSADRNQRDKSALWRKRHKYSEQLALYLHRRKEIGPDS